MKSLIITATGAYGIPKEFTFDCKSAENALAIIQGILEGCSSTNYTLTKVEMI